MKLGCTHRAWRWKQLAAGAIATLLHLPALAATAIRVHPENPHLFEWRGKHR